MVFPRNLWGKHAFPKRILTKSPPIFRKSPGGVFAGFLTGRSDEKVSHIFPENFPEKFPVGIFSEMSGNFRKVSCQILLETFPPIFEDHVMKVYRQDFLILPDEVCII